MCAVRTFLKGEVMRKIIIFTLLGFVIGIALGCIITMAFGGHKAASAMFMFQEKAIYEMEESAIQAYYNEPNEVAELFRLPCKAYSKRII